MAIIGAQNKRKRPSLLRGTSAEYLANIQTILVFELDFCSQSG